jgi:DNA-binding beta-propeller fold protein YncE
MNKINDILAKERLSRREFLVKSGACFSVIAALPTFVEAEPVRGLTMGSGEHTYDVIHDWLTPPAHIKWGDTHGVAQDSKGRIYVGHTVSPESQSGDAIAVFSEDGKFLKSWGSEFRGGSHGLDIRKEGDQEYAYHCDTARRLVVKTTLDGKVVWEKGLPQESDVYLSGKPFIPTNVAFAPDGNFYVTDGYGSDWIHRFDIQGHHLNTFGGKGTEPGKVLNAHGLWVDTRGKEPMLAVADRGNRRIQYFTLDGKHIKFVTEGMRQPCHFDIRDDLLLVPDLSSVVTLLDGNNRVVAQLGDGHPTSLRGRARCDFQPGKFIHPHDAMFLRNGDILISEWVPIGRITLLKKRG